MLREDKSPALLQGFSSVGAPQDTSFEQFYQ
jgi:hypothetical protein